MVLSPIKVGLKHSFNPLNLSRFSGSFYTVYAHSKVLYANYMVNNIFLKVCIKIVLWNAGKKRDDELVRLILNHFINQQLIGSTTIICGENFHSNLFFLSKMDHTYIYILYTSYKHNHT